MSTTSIHLDRFVLIASLWAAPVSAVAQDVNFIGVVKGVSHWQSGPSVPGLASTPYQFNAFADLNAGGQLTAATVTPPGKPSVALQADGSSWGWGAEFVSAAELDAALPNGNYTIRLTAVKDGARVITLPLTGDAYPPIPTLGGFNALQNISAQANFTVTWSPFTGGTLFDFVQFSIRRTNGGDEATVFESAQPGQPGALNGTHTSLTIPAGTLAPGQGYVGRLLFAKIVAVDANSYGQGVSAIAAYFRETTFSLSTGGSADTQAPQLWNYSPSSFHGESAPRNSGLALEFSEPMQASQSITWTGVDPAKFSYRWSADGRILFCLYAQQLPPNAAISWQLNRSAFKDVAGNLLPFDARGDFTTTSADTTGTPDVNIAGLYKVEIFTQAPGGTPQIRSVEGYGAGAFADSTGFNTLISGSVRQPNGGFFELEYSQGDALEAEIEVNSKPEQEAVAPPGTYQMTLETVHQGTKTVTLNVPANAYPSTPEVLNLAAAQGFNPAQPLTMSWKPMVGGTVTDFIGVFVDPEGGGQSVFETPEFQTGEGLNGTATSVTIPAGTLKAGRTYQVELEFVHPTTFDTTTLPGSTLVVAFGRLTHFNITAAGTVAPPVLSLTRAPDGRWNLWVTGERGVNYVLESTTQLGGWSPLTSFQIDGEGFGFADGVQSGQRFYRVREGF